MKRLLSLLLSLLICLTLAAPEVSYAATVKLTKSKLSIKIGSTYTLKLTGATGTVKWTSSDKAIATVSSKGKISAKAVGKTTITATHKTRKYKCTVTVKDPKVEVIFGAVIFDDTSIEDYAKEFHKQNPDYIDVQVYDEEHIVVTMLESYRLKSVKEFNDDFDSYLESVIANENFEGAITKISADTQLKSVKIYVDGKKYSNSFVGLKIIMATTIISDSIQALNLIDVNERNCKITIIDSKTGAVLY